MCIITFWMSILDEFVCGDFFAVKTVLVKSFTLREGKEPLMEGKTLPSLKVIGTLWVTSKVNMTLRSSSPVVQSMWPCKLRRGWRKVKTCKVWLGKIVLVQNLCTVCWGWWKAQQSLTLCSWMVYIVWLIQMGCTYQSATYLQSQF